MRPFNKEQVTLPTDGFIEPNDLEFYLLGRMSHRSRVNDGAPTTEQTGNTGVNPAMGEGGMEQTYGQSL
ncbi:hypothetical protein MBH78_19905 [Oceanimonas sp. NS1]|nr:hypothetical protein [Oceanimonas sp. NS1]